MVEWRGGQVSGVICEVLGMWVCLIDETMSSVESKHCINVVNAIVEELLKNTSSYNHTSKKDF